MGPRTLVFPGERRGWWAGQRGTLLAPSAIPCSLSLLLSLVSTVFFSRTGGVVSHRNSSTHSFLWFSWGTCASSSRSLCSLSSTLHRTQPSVKLLSLQDWQNRESLIQRLRAPVPGHFSSHSALSSYGLFAPLTLWRLFVSLRPLVQTLGNCPASGAPWFPAMSSIPRKGVG